MRANLQYPAGLPALTSAAVFTGLFLVAGLILTPVPANARPADDQALLAGTGSATSIPGLSGTVAISAEQHRRGGGSGGGGQSSGGGGGQAVPRGGSGGGSSAGGTRSGGSSGGGAVTRGGDASGRGDNTASGRSGGTPPYSRPRDGQPATGTAVERRDGGGRGPDTIIVGGGYYGGFYPWGWGGLGLGGYYGWYDPWGWYDPYPPAGGYGYYADGALKLKVKPRQAEVFVDGYFAGAVDDYDGVFQRLRLEPGPHRIEIRLDGYEPLSFEIRIQPDRTVTYRGEMRKVGES